jgi:hypothetical protein
MMDILLIGWIKELIGKGMTARIRDTNNVTNSFNRVRCKVGVNFLVVEMETKKEADIRSVTI